MSTHNCSFGTGYHATKIKTLFNRFFKDSASTQSSKKIMEAFVKSKLPTYLKDNGFTTVEKADVAFVFDTLGGYFNTVLASAIGEGDTAKYNKYEALQQSLSESLVKKDLLMKQMNNQKAPKVTAKSESTVNPVIPGTNDSTPLVLQFPVEEALPNPEVEEATQKVTVPIANTVEQNTSLFEVADDNSPGGQVLNLGTENLMVTSAQEVAPITERNLPQPAPINSLTNLTTQADINNAFLGSISAKTLLEGNVNLLVIRDFLIDRKNKKYLTPVAVDATIKSFKETQLNALVQFVLSRNHEGIEFNPGEEQLYDENGIMSPTFNETISKISYYFTDIIKVDSNKLEDWSRSPSGTENFNNMVAYLKFILLANFDTLLLKHGQGVFSIGSGLVNSPSENRNTVKYHLDIDNNMQMHIFTSKEQYSLSDQQTSIFKALMGIMPSVKWNRGASLNERLTVSSRNKFDIVSINTVIAMMMDFSKKNPDLVPQYDRANPSYSLQKLLEFMVNKYINPDNKINKKLHKAFNSSDLDILMSMYMFFYRTSDSEEELGKILGPKAFKEYESKQLQNVLGPSYHQLAINAGLDNLSKLDYMSLITFNINKSDLNDYTEIAYDPKIKEMNFNRPDSKIFEGKAIQFENSLNNAASHNYSGDTTLVDNALDGIEIDYNTGVVTFTNIQPGKNVIVNFNSSSNEMVDMSQLNNSEDLFKNAVFIKYIEDNIPMLTLSTKADLKEELVKATGTESSKTAIEYLFNIAAASAFVKGVYRENGYDVTKALNNSFLKTRANEGLRVFNKDIGDDGLILTSALYKSLKTHSDVLSKALAAVEGSLFRAVIKVATGDAMPLQVETRYLYMTKDIIDHSLRMNKGKEYTMPTAGNFFVLNRKTADFDSAIRTYVGKEKHSADLTPQEIAISSILHEFFGASYKENAVYIQPTVYTDKNTHNLLKIDLGKSYKFNGRSTFPTVIFKEASNKILLESMYYSNATYYENLGHRMMDVYSAAFANYVGGAENLQAYAKANKLPALDNKNKTKLEIIDAWMRTMDEDQFRSSFYAVPGNPGLVEDFGIRRSVKDGKKIIHLPETLVSFSNMYKRGDITPQFTEMVNRTLNDFIDDLTEFRVQIPFTTFGVDSPVLLKAVTDYVPVKKDDDGTELDTVEEFKKDFVDVAGIMKLKSDSGEINPLISRYFYTNLLISDAHQQATMGTVHDHPAKGKIKGGDRVNQQIGLQTAMWNKRQLGGTPMKPFLQNLISGVRETVTTVHVKDPTLKVFSSYGTEDKMTVTDGAIFTSMAQIILANNSLLDNRVGVNMKTLGLSMDPYYNVFNLEKCAEFGMTNEWARLSAGSNDPSVAGEGGRLKDIGELYKNAYGISLIWTGPDGSSYLPNIMTDFDGNDITIQDVAPNGAFYKDENGDIIQVTNIAKTQVSAEGHNQIIVTKVNLSKALDAEGRTTVATVAIPDLHALWQVFGGIHSISLNENGNIEAEDKTFAYSDASHYALVEFINRVGTWLDKEGLQTLPPVLVQTHPDLVSKADIIKNNRTQSLKGKVAPTQTTIWQPLKSAFIGRFTFAGAKKSGATSIISMEEAFTPGKDLPRKEISLLSTGLLLGTEHETDGAELSEMTQIISAISFNGDTFSIAEDAYETMSDLVALKLRVYTDALAEKNGKNKEDFYNKVVTMLVKTFEAKNQQTISNFIATLVKTKLSKRFVSSKSLVVQSEGLLNNEDNALMVGLDMPFSAEIYSSFITLFANTLNKEAIRRKQAGLGAVLKPSGTTVKLYDVVINGKPAVVTYDGLKNIPKEALAVQIPVNQVKMYDWVLDTTGHEIHLDTPTKLKSYKEGRIDGFASAPVDGIVTKLYGKPRELKPREVSFTIAGSNGVVRSIWETDIYVAVELFQKALNGEELTPEQWELIQNETMPRSGRIYTPEELLKGGPETIQIFKNKIHEAFREAEENNRVRLDGNWVTINDVEVTPGEALAPNIYRSKFGIPEGMQPHEVDEDFFITMLEKKRMPTIVGADRFLRVANGNHLYVFAQQTKENIEQGLPILIESRSTDVEGTFIDMSSKIEMIDGERWVLDDNNNLDYKIPDNAIPYKFVQEGKIVDAIVVKTSSMEDSHREILEAFPTSIRPTEEELDKLAEGIPEHAAKMYASYQESLKFVSARIPGQGPQSFTTVKVVGYLYTEGNTIMTNHYTSFLKGEDYDIDKGYWMGKTVNKAGLIETWVPYEYTTARELELLLQMPIPNQNYNRNRLPSGDPDSVLTLSEAEVNAVVSGVITPKLVKVLNKLNRVDSYDFESDDLANIPEFLDIVENYFNHEPNKDSLEDIYKNKLSMSVYNMSESARNTVHNESEVTLGDVKDAAENAKPGRPLNPYNPADIYRIQYANMVGKKVVGIAAVALKVWSALSYYGNYKAANGDFNDIFINKPVTVNGKQYTFATFANVNFYNTPYNDLTESQITELVLQEGLDVNDPVIREEVKKNFITANRNRNFGRFIEFVSTKLSQSPDSTPASIRAVVDSAVKMFDINYDQSLVLSALLTAATDNAKELVLAKINAGPDTAGIYAHLIMLGMPFSTIAEMMTSPEIQWIIDNSKPNVFDRNSTFNNVKSAIKKRLEGPSLSEVTNDSSVKDAMDMHYLGLANEYLQTHNLLQGTTTLVEKVGTKNPSPLSVADARKFLGEVKEVDGKKEIIPASYKTVLDYFTFLASKPYPKEATIPMQPRGREDEDMMEVLDDINDLTDLESDTRRNIAYIAKPSFLHINNVLTYLIQLGPDMFEDSKIESVKSFEKINRDAEEVNILGRILSINQGLKTKAYEEYALMKRINNFVINQFGYYILGEDVKAEKIIDEGSEAEIKFNALVTELSKELGISELDAKNKLVKLIGNFSLNDYIIASPADKLFIKAAYARIKSTYNIFDILESVPHYKEMLKAHRLMIDGPSAVSIKARAVEKLLDLVVREEISTTKKVGILVGKTVVPILNLVPTLEEKNFKRLESFCDDVIIVKWLKNLSPDRRQFSFDSNIYYRMNAGKLERVKDQAVSTIHIDLATTAGRANFITMFHNKVLEWKEAYKDNFFMQDINIDYKKDDLVGKQWPFYRMSINVLANDDYSKNTFSTLVSSFNDLPGDIKDLIYIYNTLIHKNKVNRESFSKLFEYNNNYSTSTYMFNFQKAIAEMDKEGEVITELKENPKAFDFTLDDIIVEGFASRIYNFNGGFKGKYVYMVGKNENNELSITYYKHDGADYVPYTHFADRRAIPIGTDSEHALLVNRRVKDAAFASIKDKLNSLKIAVNNISNIKINCI